MLVLVTGSRTFTNKSLIELAFDELYPPDEVTLIHGDCRGADKLAASIALEYGFEVQAYPADWKKYGRAAGPIRNRLMLDQNPDIVLAFPLPGSKGTKNCIRQAEKRGFTVKVYRRLE